MRASQEAPTSRLLRTSRSTEEAKADHDVQRKERHADRAEASAEDAIVFVFAALEEAESQVLNAAVARAEADAAVAAG